MDAIFSVSALLLGALLVAYLYVTRHFGYWTKRGVPGPRPTPFLGNFKDVLFQKVSAGDWLLDIYKKTAGSPHAGFFILDKPAILIRDPDVIKNIMIKDFAHFVNHFAETSPKGDTLVSKGLFALRGEEWKHMRDNMSPVFTSGRLKKMFPLIVECGLELDKHVAQIADKSKTVEVKELLAKSSTDVITTCAFGINSNCMTNPNAEFREFGRAIFVMEPRRAFEMMTVFFLPSWSKFLRVGFFPQQTTDFLREVLTKTFLARETSKATRDDVIDHLIQIKNKVNLPKDDARINTKETNENTRERQDKKGFTGDMDDLLAQAAIFYSAGFETSASTSTFALYELAMSPEIQIKARQEVLEVIARHGGEITYEGVQEMKYLEAVVDETLRLYPIVPFLDRMCTKEYVVPGTDLTIEKGTPVFFSLFGLHLDPEYFPDPEKFMPERFFGGQSIRSGTYMPFGEGPRICIGMRFAMIAVKTQLANILMHCEVSPVEGKTPSSLEFNRRCSMLSLNSDIPLLFTRIKS